MIKYVEGNLLEAPTEALVNTVNEVGVMGKGIALMFSEAFPDNTAAYIRACQAKQVHVGRMFVTVEGRARFSVLPGRIRPRADVLAGRTKPAALGSDPGQ